MFRLIHSADWQLGARFAQFGAKASRLREARMVTLKRTLELAAQLAFAQAEARVTVTKVDLPPDFEKLPERNKRAVARTQGWCIRIAHDLIEHRKQAATKAVLTPLESRLTSAFAELTGLTDREVFLDENLQIAGIGRTRDSAHAFDGLSQGAKEQLLLCLRLAVAQELATEEPQVLILDDVLVNTDQVRQERILDVLGTQAERLQILILTCHPDRYRGIGESLTLA